MSLITNVFLHFSRTETQFRLQLMQIERDNVTLRSENATLNGLINLERNKTAIHEKKIETMETNIDELNRRLRERDHQVKELQKQLNQKQYQINQKELENEKQRRKFSTKIAAEAEKMNRELNSKFRAEKDLLHVSRTCTSYGEHSVHPSPYFRIVFALKTTDCSRLVKLLTTGTWRTSILIRIRGANVS